MNDTKKSAEDIATPPRVIQVWKRVLTIITLQIFLIGQISPTWAAPSFAPDSCVQSEPDTCIDSTPCKNFGGITACLAGITGPDGSTNVSETCWNYKAQFKCRDTEYMDTCGDLVAKGCSQINSQCQTGADGKLMMLDGKCTTFTQTYQCETSPPTTSQVQDCSGATVCGSDGNCWDTPSTPDNDFANAVTRMEMVRQASVYMGTNGRMFDGVGESCTEGYGGLRSCCDSDTSGQSNASTMKSTAASVALSAAWKYGKEYAVQGSPYVYDFMYSAGTWAESGANAMFGSTSTAVSDYIAKSAAESAAANAGGAAVGAGGIGAYGITYGASGAAGVAAGGTIGAGAGTLGGPLYSLGGGFAFDPVSLGIAIAIMIIMKMMACTPEEAALAMHKGSNLCTPVGSYCSTKFLGACMVTTQAYCCFNSVLAKIINKQGRSQLGKSYGNPENPDCSGFTVPEIQSLDFSTIDMAEFTNTIVPNLSNMPDVPGLTSAVSERQSGRTVNP